MDEMVFGRYRLIALIGGGGMGKVYKAHDTVIGRDVAIKVLPVELGEQPGYRERFRREAHTTARLTEPHVIPIYDTGETDDGHLYLVMPLIDGTDVQGLLKRDGPMTPARAVAVIEQLAAALNAAHEAGLVHRDIKPSNALVTGADFVYLIDFGIAHDAAATKLTNTGTMVGTLAYMAPERFTAGTADARADVYALACVLYECLTGVQPYPGNSIEQQIAGHLTLAPPKPAGTNPTIPVGFDAVIATGMAKSPDQRYQSANDLATAARHALTETPTPSFNPDTAPTLLATPPIPATEPVHRPADPHLAATQQRPPGPPGVPPALPAHNPPTQAKTPRPPRGWLIVGLIVLVAVLALVGIHLHGQHPQPSDTSQPSTTLQPITTAPTVTAPPTIAPVKAAALDGMLLTVDQINTIMGATGMTGTTDNGGFDAHTYISDQACLPLANPAETEVYAGSGYAAMRAQSLQEPGSTFKHLVEQAVVSFPSAQAADAFFADSVQRWPACANRQYTANYQRPFVYDVGPVSNLHGMLSANRAQQNANGFTWQRALTVSNNVAVDILAGSYNPTSAAVTIAQQIAAKVPT